MKATGIVRRIDDLGRVVIPKEIRRTMRIREGDPLEIYTGAGGEVIFKKYSPMGELAADAEVFAESLSSQSKLAVIICDRDRCIAASGVSKKEVLEKQNSAELEEIINMRQNRMFNENEQKTALTGSNLPIAVAAPILSAGDITGAVVFLSVDGNWATESDYKLAVTAAQFLGNRIQ